MKSGYLIKSPSEKPRKWQLQRWHRRYFLLADSRLVYPLVNRYLRLEYYQSEEDARKLAFHKGKDNTARWHAFSGVPYKLHRGRGRLKLIIHPKYEDNKRATTPQVQSSLGSIGKNDTLIYYMCDEVGVSIVNRGEPARTLILLSEASEQLVICRHKGQGGRIFLSRSQTNHTGKYVWFPCKRSGNETQHLHSSRQQDGSLALLQECGWTASGV